MKMSRNYKMMGNLVLALASALLVAGFAGAQSVPYTTGKFSLPFEARWGLVTLPAGDYQFQMDNMKATGPIEIFRGTKAVALISSQGYSTVSSGRAALTVVRTAEGSTVRDLSLPEIGKVLHYAPHKPRPGSAAAEREIAQMVMVPIEGK